MADPVVYIRANDVHVATDYLTGHCLLEARIRLAISKDSLAGLTHPPDFEALRQAYLDVFQKWCVDTGITPVKVVQAPAWRGEFPG